MERERDEKAAKEALHHSTAGTKSSSPRPSSSPRYSFRHYSPVRKTSGKETNPSQTTEAEAATTATTLRPLSLGRSVMERGMWEQVETGAKRVSPRPSSSSVPSHSGASPIESPRASSAVLGPSGSAEDHRVSAILRPKPPSSTGRGKPARARSAPRHRTGGRRIVTRGPYHSHHRPITPGLGFLDQWLDHDEDVLAEPESPSDSITPAATSLSASSGASAHGTAVSGSKGGVFVLF